VIGAPITPYGKGKQKRGFLPLRDSMQCLTLALEKPPNKGEYRVLNQFEQVYTILQLAQEVYNAAALRGIDAKIRRVENPRMEAAVHHYNPDRKKLLKLGYKPNGDLHGELTGIIDDLHIYSDRIRARKHLLIPDVRWDGTRKPVKFVAKK
jgi:UDP-sulfoquinovose synthase